MNLNYLVCLQYLFHEFPRAYSLVNFSYFLDGHRVLIAMISLAILRFRILFFDDLHVCLLFHSLYIVKSNEFNL